MKKSKRVWAFLCLLLLFLSKPCLSSILFVDSQWLAQHRGEVVVLDARPYRNYFWSHIPGAFSAPWKVFTQQSMKMGESGWGMLLPDQLLTEQISALGIHAESSVVVYANYPGWGDDGQVAWILKMAGLEKVYLLDGGLDAWQAAGGSVTMKEATAQKSEFPISLNHDLVISTEDIVASSNLVFVDTRALEEFDGAVNFGEARGGHLPGAIHLPFTELFAEDGRIKAKEVLEELFKGSGLRKTDKIVAYCTAGIRSAYVTLVLRSLGYDLARNYDAGFYEWARQQDLLVE